MLSFREILIDLALKAGKEILKYYKKNTAITYKRDNSPLTEADLSANRIIVQGLENTQIPIISEESDTILYETRKTWDKFWLIDPLDGTKQFVKNEDEFTVNIALIVNDSPVEGVVFAPALGVLYYGNQIQGAERIQVDKNLIPEKISCLKSDTIRIVASRSHLNESTQKYIQSITSVYNRTSIVHVGSSLKFCLIASGEADIYPRIGSINEWDIAAGHAVLNAAGGCVIKIDTGTDIQYNSQNLLTPDFLALSDKDIFKNIDRLLKK